MSGRFKGLTVEYQKGKDKMNFEDTKKFTESVLKYGTSLDNANKVMDEAIGSVLMKSHRKAAELDKLEIQFKSLTDKGIKEVLQLVKQYGLPSEVETIEYSRKVKVHPAMADYIEQEAEINDLSLMYIMKNFTESEHWQTYANCDDNYEDWSQVLANAVMHGYEVKEEPKWVVKNNKGKYFCTMGFSTNQNKISNVIWQREKKFEFKTKEAAEAVILLVGGTVEKEGTK